MKQDLNSDNKQQLKIIISGQVQGVWFRQSTKRVALEHNISGYAKNLDDGTVEVLAQGEPRALDKLVDFLHHGPEHARVEWVVINKVTLPIVCDFITL